MVGVTLKDEITFAEDALRKAKRDLDREERTARLYDDPIDYSPALRRALKIANENYKKAERKLQRLKRKGNPMAKRTLSPAQKEALRRGRAKLAGKRQRKKGTRKANPLKPGYSTRIVSANVSELLKTGHTQAQALRIALTSARKSYRAKYPRGAFPPLIALTRTRRKNPGPPTRGPVSGSDIKFMRQKLGQSLSAQQRVGKKTLKRYPQAGVKTLGYRKNPPHYVLKSKKGYFDGAGWSSTKNGAAQYMSLRKAEIIGHKVANATNLQVGVLPV